MQAVVVGLLAASAPTVADVATLTPSRDNSLFENDGTLSNGQGQYLFSGETAAFASRRAVIAFDVAGSVPPGATITGVTLTLQVSLAVLGPQPMTIHRLTADWGEGASDAGVPGGAGAPAAPGDATWTHRFFGTTMTWSSPGGDFDATASATTMVGVTGESATWGSTPAMVADVQGWLDDASDNFGWIIVGNEPVQGSAKRFDSRESPVESLRPRLSVEFTASTTSAGTVPNGDDLPGTPLALDKVPGGDLLLSWGDSCLQADDDYEIYEGALGDFSGHVPLFCSTGGATTQVITPGSGRTFYLIVPRNASREGSYGTRSGVIERPAGAVVCLPQLLAGCQ